MNIPGDSDPIWAVVKAEAIRRGYRFEELSDGSEVRLIRPDGTTAVIAKRNPLSKLDLAQRKAVR